MGTNKMDKKAGEKIEYFMDLYGSAEGGYPGLYGKWMGMHAQSGQAGSRRGGVRECLFPKPCLCAQQGKLSHRALSENLRPQAERTGYRRRRTIVSQNAGWQGILLRTGREAASVCLPSWYGKTGRTADWWRISCVQMVTPPAAPSWHKLALQCL